MRRIGGYISALLLCIFSPEPCSSFFSHPSSSSGRYVVSTPYQTSEPFYSHSLSRPVLRATAPELASSYERLIETLYARPNDISPIEQKMTHILSDFKAASTASTFEYIRDITKAKQFGTFVNVVSADFSSTLLSFGTAAEALGINRDIAEFVLIIFAFGAVSLLSRPFLGDRWRYQKKPRSPYSEEYNAEEADLYFESKPLRVVVRSIEILGASLSFGLSILIDYLNDKINDLETESKRAEELTAILTQLGPTFIKIGQSLSIRSDLLRPAYLRALSTLQDQVSLVKMTFDVVYILNII